jgi:PAS domain S-box-containing protein
MAIPLRVLIIEDSDSDAALNVRELEKAGYEITHELVSTGKEMEAALHTLPFDIIISDHNLPQFNSLKALTILKESALDIPFLVVSGTIGEEMAVQIMKAGAHDYVMKGNLSRLGTAVERELRDVTERHKRKQAEDALRQSEEKYRQLVDNLREGIWVIDKDSCTTFVNPSMAEMLGYNTDEMLGRHLFSFMDERGIKLATQLLNRRKEGVKEQHDFEFLRKDGTRVYFSLETSPITDKDGNYIGAISGVQDITLRKKMQEQLIMQDRLASIGLLVSGVAHEINNPLTGVIGFSDLLLQKVLPADIMADLQMINDEARRTASIVKNLLTFARKQPEGKTSLDINENIQKVLNLRAHEQKVNNIEVIAQFTSDLPQVTGNDSQLQQVFFNIVINAEFFMLEAHGKGILTIITERAEDFVRCSFADDGPGISEEHLRRLFTPFFTTKEEGKGTGLGLSICYGIITEHGGKIHVESETGKGTTFIIELPINKY